MGTKASERRWDAREYLRVSEAGLGRSTDEQHTENVEATEEQGWTLGEPYEDSDFSASRFARKARPDYAKLISDLETGRFGAGVLILWESSRGSRRTGEWVTLIELCEDQGVKIWVTTHGRLYDPANHRDRKSLLEDAIGSEYASAETSKRVRRATRAAATAGRPHGRTPYGYTRVYGPHPDTGKVVLLSQEIEESEAPNVRELFERLDNAHSLKAIERDWKERWIRRRDGGLFTPQHLRKLALNPAYAGLRLFSPGRTPGKNETPGTLIEASWSALVPRDLFDRVERRLNAEERKTSRGGAAKHFLSLIAVCDVCGGPLAAKNLPAGWRYVCTQKGCVKVPMSELDSLTEEEILVYLERDDVYRFLESADGDTDEELREVRAALAAVMSELEELQETLDRGEISAQMAGRSEVSKLQRKDQLEAQERELSAPAGLGPIAPGEDVRVRWDDAPMSAKRETARALLVPAVLGQVRVGRAISRSAPVSERVVWDTDSRT